MLNYVLSDDRASTASLFTSLDSYMSYYLSPEASEFLSELEGFKGDFAETMNPGAYIENWKELLLGFSNRNRRPLKGMSAVIDALVPSVRSYGGKLYAGSEVLSIEKVDSEFILRTKNMAIVAQKIVIAAHPAGFIKVKGGVAEEIRRESVFQSIKIIPAFKGAAVYRNAWWEKTGNDTGNLNLEPRQKFISNSNCLGVTLPYG